MSALCQKRTFYSSFDHLVGASEQRADMSAQKEKGPAQWPVPPIAHTSLW